MALNLKSILSTVGSTVGGIGFSYLGSSSVAQKLQAYDRAAQTAVKSAVTDADNGIDHLQKAFDTWEENNPVVSTAIDTMVSILKTMGVHVPQRDMVVIHVKAAIAELASIFIPVPADFVEKPDSQKISDTPQI